jgi:S-adenosylmethionine:tRNA ribosyltransferase-isomerase
MQRQDFNFELPTELIAQRPLPTRSDSRMLLLDGASGALSDRRFTDLPGVLEPGDLLVFNDTRVIPARLYGTKPTGGRVELLVERTHDAERALVMLRASKPTRAGTLIEVAPGQRLRVVARHDDLYEVESLDGPFLPLLERHGHMPLPPYMSRADDADDRERYQTIFATAPGAAAAPTAGLHFDAAMLDALAARGVERAALTLHVGAGTFQPVRVDDLSQHRMHSERVTVPPAAVAAVAAARARGRRVVAVGTTVVRSLETAAADGALVPYHGETSIFITPGFRFRVIDALFTNFHLPESTLLMLVAAFAGRERVLAAYRHAVAARYRFFSYGDAMFVSPDPAALAARA